MFVRGGSAEFEKSARAVLYLKYVRLLCKLYKLYNLIILINCKWFQVVVFFSPRDIKVRFYSQNMYLEQKGGQQLLIDCSRLYGQDGRGTYQA